MLISVYLCVLLSNRMKVVLVGASFTARTHQRRNGAPVYSSTFSSTGKKGQKLEETMKGRRGKSAADLFCEGCSPWLDASSLHIIYTSLRSDTRLCRYSVDTNLQGGRFQSTRNMTRKVKGCLAAPAADTVRDCVFASHTCSRCPQP